MPNRTRRNLIVGASIGGAAALVGRANAQALRLDGGGLTLTPDNWDAESPPRLEFLCEARVQLHFPPMDVGNIPDGRRVIFFIKGGTFEGPHMNGRVVPDAGADWARMRPDGTAALDVRFSLETDDGALIYAYWQARFWSAPEDVAYATDLEKPDDPDGAWRYYFRAAPFFETGDERYNWLNKIIAVTKSRTGGGGPIHRIFAVL